MKRSAVFLLLPLLVMAGSWSGSFNFPNGSIDITRTSRDGRSFELVTISRPDQDGNMVLLEDLARPRLPGWSFTLVIPQGMRIASVEAEVRNAQSLPGRHSLFPNQPPVPVFESRLPDFVPPDEEVYSSDAAYPGIRAEHGPVGVKSGFRLATVTLYPLQYFPASGRLELATAVDITVHYEPDSEARTEFLTASQSHVFLSAVRPLVINPTQVARYAPPCRESDFGDIDCVIITSSGLQAHFQPLVDWHTQKGYKTEVRTVSWITANYSGRDTQERIRNFIIDYYNNEGLKWIILGGDNSIVPARRARAYVNSETGNIPCDLYYADLQGDWDSNGNSIFGEPTDIVDLYYDVFIGRASVDNQTQVQTFVNKVITHEKNPPTDYLRRILLVDALLWAGHNQQQSNDSIANITPSGWVDRFIHNPGNTYTVGDSINNGFQFAHLVGHGNASGVYDGGTRYYGTSTAGNQTNGSRVNLMNSMACTAGNFESSDCLAEAAHNAPNGGSIATIFNSRYGWGQPPGIGPSELLDVRFYDFFFNHDTMPIGITHAESKEFYRNSAISQQVWRWCYYGLNLLGDPLLMMYEDIPGQLDATFDDPIPTGSQDFTVRVRSGGNPVRNALVCVAKATEVYERGFTDAGGRVTLTINPATTGYLQVTATAANYLPDENSCQVMVINHDVGCYRIVSPAGTVDSGFTVTPQAMVRNYGSLVATNVPVRFKIGAAYLVDAVIPTLAVGDSALVSFTPWAVVPGNYTVSCSTRLSGDTDNSNDRTSGNLFVRNRDVGPVAIEAPATADSGDVIPLAVVVRNFGNTNEAFNVRLEISGTGYSETGNINLSAGEQDTLDFPAWTALERGAHTLACTTMLAGDMNPANDRVSASTFVRVNDVSCTGVIAPAGTFDSTDTRIVRARIANPGTESEAFPVVFRITGPTNWSDTTFIRNLNPGDSTVAVFTDWPVGPRGNYTASCSTMRADDIDSTNDRASGSFTVIVHDAEVLEITAPAGHVDSGATITPEARIRNSGSAPESFDVEFTITDGYSSVLSISLSPGTDSLVSFTPWTANVPGGFTTRCSTRLPGDAYPDNDCRTGTVTVAVTDVGVAAVLAPAAVIEPGPVTPIARVANYSPSAQSFTAFLTISAQPQDSVVFLDSAAVDQLGPDSTLDLSFSSWNAELGTYQVCCSTWLAGDENPSNDVITRDFLVVDAPIPPGNWTEVAPMPLAPSSKPVKRGGWLAYNSGNGLIYGAKGYKTTDFYSYSIAGNAWTHLTGMPYETHSNPKWAKKVPRKGSKGVADGNNSVYVTQGNNTLGFWRYDIATNSWTELEDVPLGPSRKKVKGGTDLAYLVRGGTPYVYLLKGYRDEFHRYNVLSGAWEELAPAPTGQRAKWDKGSWLVAEDENATVLYAHKAKYNELWSYNVLSDSWNPELEGMPFTGMQGRKKKSKDGGCGTWYNGEMYALKGGNTNEFWKYTPAGNLWTELDSMPTMGSTGSRKRVKHGGDIVRAINSLYALKGNKTREFWTCTPGTVTFCGLGCPQRNGIAGATGDAKPTVGFDLRPNPTAGRVAAVGNRTDQPARLKLISPLGRVVRETSILPGRTAQLDISRLLAGTYFVCLKTSDGTEIRKLVIHR